MLFYRKRASAGFKMSPKENGVLQRYGIVSRLRFCIMYLSENDFIIRRRTEMSDINGNKFIYIVLSSTSGKMGRFIRFATGYFYNHVSVSLEPDINTLFSFARYYKNTPLFGGFVEESIMRYSSLEEIASIKIFKIPVTETQYSEIKIRIDQLKAESEKYIYNTISALLAPVHRSVSICNAYTCVEFMVNLLWLSGIDMGIYPGAFHTIEELGEHLAYRTVYEGPASEYMMRGEWGKDNFCIKKSKIFYITGTAKNFGRLIIRVIK